MARDVNQTDLHIRILRCVRERIEPITVSAIETKLGMRPGDLEWIHAECDTGSRVFVRRGQDPSNREWLLSLTMTGWQILLDFESLEHARKSSRTATRIAAAAMLVALATLFVTLKSLGLNH